MEIFLALIPALFRIVISPIKWVYTWMHVKRHCKRHPANILGPISKGFLPDEMLERDHAYEMVKRDSSIGFQAIICKYCHKQIGVRMENYGPIHL